MSEIRATLQVDAEANAAILQFQENSPGEDIVTPIRNSSGSVVATITFSSRGQLVQVELLDATRQLPNK